MRGNRLSVIRLSGNVGKGNQVIGDQIIVSLTDYQ